MIDVRFHEAAEAELYEALGFLELRAKGLGRRLLNEVRATAARIAEFPLLGAEVRPGCVSSSFGPSAMRSSTPSTIAVCSSWRWPTGAAGRISGPGASTPP
jgi:plasmid stabilization system protein ParE